MHTTCAWSPPEEEEEEKEKKEKEKEEKEQGTSFAGGIVIYDDDSTASYIELVKNKAKERLATVLKQVNNARKSTKEEAKLADGGTFVYAGNISFVVHLTSHLI